MDDIRAVMDAAGVERAALFGFEIGANLCAVFAAAQPSRVFACVLHGSVARGLRGRPTTHGRGASERWDAYLDDIDRLLGNAGDGRRARRARRTRRMPRTRRFGRRSPRSSAPRPAPARRSSSSGCSGTRTSATCCRRSRSRCWSRSACMIEYIAIDEARYLATNIPGARLLELEGADHYPLSGDQEPLMDAIERFLAAAHGAEVDFDRVLATVLFTDIVGSTETAVTAGRPGLEGPARRRTTGGSGRCWRGTAGARSTSPATGSSRCSTALRAPSDAASRSARTRARSGLEVRVGIHTGEVELDGAAVRGIAVHIGSRVAGQAGGRRGPRLEHGQGPRRGLWARLREPRPARAQGRPGPWHLYAASAPETGRRRLGAATAPSARRPGAVGSVSECPLLVAARPHRAPAAAFSASTRNGLNSSSSAGAAGATGSGALVLGGRTVARRPSRNGL